MSTLTIKDWLQAMIEATVETAEQSLSIKATPEDSDAEESMSIVNPDWSGSFLSLVSETDSVQIGLVSDDEGLQHLSQAMLGLTEETLVSEADVADAVGEVINVLAGGVKRRLNEQAKNIKLGLPMFVQGMVSLGEKLDSLVRKVTVGTDTTYVIIIRKKG